MVDEFTRADINRLRKRHIAAFLSGDDSAYAETGMILRRWLVAHNLEQKPGQGRVLNGYYSAARHKLCRLGQWPVRCRCLQWHDGRAHLTDGTERLYACANPCLLGIEVAHRLKRLA